jgi:hypothetical protein
MRTAVGGSMIARDDHGPLGADLTQQPMQVGVEAANVRPVARRRDAVRVTLMIGRDEVGDQEVGCLA